MTAITYTTNLTAFLTDQGLDLVLKHSLDRNAPAKRATLPWDTRLGTIDGLKVSVEFIDNDDNALMVILEDTMFRIFEQEAGHFFGYAKPRPKLQISVAEARRLAAA